MFLLGVEWCRGFVALFEAGNPFFSQEDIGISTTIFLNVICCSLCLVMLNPVKKRGDVKMSCG